MGYNNIFSTANNPPLIQGPDTFLATVGELSEYTFNVTDDDNFTLSVAMAGVSTELIDTMVNGVFIFRITLPAADSGFTLDITATDDEGASSLFSPQVQICACLNGGNCTIDGILNPTADPLLLRCICPLGTLQQLNNVAESEPCLL